MNIILRKLLIFARKYVTYTVIGGSAGLVILSNISFADRQISSFLLAPIFENNSGGGEIIESATQKSSGNVISQTALAPIANAQINEESNINNEYITIQGDSLIASSRPLTTETGQGRSDIIEYTVENGDTASSISAKLGITTNTLLWANDLQISSVIKPGDKLVILPTTGVKHTIKKNETVASIAKKYKAEPEKIIAFNDLPADGRINQGEELIIPDGEIPPPPAPKKPKNTATFASAPAQSSISGSGSGYFIFPTSGKNYGRIHSNNGVDISNKCGTPIYVSAEGTVNTSKGGWNGGYGTYVKVSHPNSTETLYAHLSSLGVSVGQSVDKGQFVGYMGTTGRSTGCHLHFEVHGATNPLAR